MDRNIPDDCHNEFAPWNEEEYRCPVCGNVYPDTECTPDECKESEDE